MSIFTDVPEIVEAENKLCQLVKKRFNRVAEIDAESIFEDLVKELGMDEVCRNPDAAIEYAEDEGWIHESANDNLMYNFDNELVRFCECAKDKVDEEEAMYLAKQDICSGDKEPDWAVDSAYAYEAWTAAIKDKLREVINKKCASRW